MIMMMALKENVFSQIILMKSFLTLIRLDVKLIQFTFIHPASQSVSHPSIHSFIYSFNHYIRTKSKR